MIRDLKTDSPSEDARPDSGHYWTRWQLPALGLIVVIVIGAATYLFGRQFRANSNLAASSNMVFEDPMWAMHAGMQDMSAMMYSSAPTLTGSPPKGTPLAEMAVRFYDFGSLSGSQEVSHNFILKNGGDAPLIVIHAYATCGCTSAEISASIIPPGKAGLVTVYFTPTLSTDGSQAVRRGVILETNDPVNPEIEIWVQAAIE